MAGILDGISNFFGGIGASMNPAIQENQFRQQAYQGLVPQMGPGEAALALSQPGLQQQLWQQRLFSAQLEDFMRKHPGADLNQAMYGTSPQGMNVEFGPPPLVPGQKVGPLEGTGTLQRGPNGWYVQPPAFMQGGPPAGAQGQPSQQPQGGLNSAIGTAAEVERQIAAAKELGQHQGESAATVNSATDEVDRSIKLIDELAVHPGQRWATGIWANIPGGPPKGTDAYAFTKGVSQLKDKLTLDLMPTLQKMRTSPAVLEFLNKATAGQELDLGSPDFPKNLQDTRAALVQIRAAIQKQANVPVTEAPRVKPPQAAIDYLKKDPKLKAQFEAKYGSGSAAEALGQ